MTEKKKHWREFYIVLIATVFSLGITLLIARIAMGITPKKLFNEVLDKGFINDKS